MEFNTTDANLLRLHFHTETIGSTTIFPDGDNNLTVTSKNETVEDVVINGLPRGWRLRYAASGERASSYTNVRRPALVVDDVCPRKRRFYPADVINHPTVWKVVFSEMILVFQIESAGFSNGLHYANLVNCTYVIFAQNASDDDEGVSSAARVQLEFRAFHTERHHDFLQIYDGEFIDDAKLLTRFAILIFWKIFQERSFDLQYIWFCIIMTHFMLTAFLQFLWIIFHHNRILL